jgi:hypothetical protein
VPLTFVASGVPFKFVDIDAHTYCMDQHLILESLKDSDCVGMIFIYSYGIQTSFDEFFFSIKESRPNFKIIADKCLNPPSLNEEEMSEYCDLTLFSTGYSKFVDLGNGGFGFLGENSAYKKFKTSFDVSASLEMETHYKQCLQNDFLIQNSGPGWIDNRTLEPDELKRYEHKIRRQKQVMIEHKRSLNEIYKHLIPKEYWLTSDSGPVDSWRFNIVVPDKRRLLKKIFEHDLFASTHYQPADKIFDVDVIGSGCNSYALYAGVINLFNDINFTTKMAEAVSKLALEYYKLEEETYVHSIQ